MNILEIYRKYYLPENLQMHMLRVAACSYLIIDNWNGPEIDKEAIIRVCLLHDMGNKENIIIMLEDYKKVCEEIYKFPIKNNTSNLVKFKYDNDEEIKQMYKDLKAKNIEFFMELKQTEYGTIEFGIFDLDKI